MKNKIKANKIPHFSKLFIIKVHFNPYWEAKQK